MNTILGQFLENELNAFISDQRLIPQDNLVRLIAKAFEAYDQYRRLVSFNNGNSEPIKNECSCNRKYGVAPVGDQALVSLHPRINERLDYIDSNLHACPDLDQDFKDLEYCKAVLNSMRSADDRGKNI